MLRKLKLFKRFPKLTWKQGEKSHIVKPETRVKYPALSEDFALLDKHLMKYFWELDEGALQSQNKFRRAQVIVIMFTASATIFGAIQAAYPAWKLPVGITEAVLAAVATVFIANIQTLKTHEGYYTNRLKAERLRSEYFLFLGRAEPYSNDNDRESNLVRRVAEIRQKKEVSREPAQ
jgi:Protein of unknown function (DUF4231)